MCACPVMSTARVSRKRSGSALTFQGSKEVFSGSRKYPVTALRSRHNHLCAVSRLCFIKMNDIPCVPACSSAMTPTSTLQKGQRGGK